MNLVLGISGKQTYLISTKHLIFPIIESFSKNPFISYQSFLCLIHTFPSPPPPFLHLHPVYERTICERIRIQTVAHRICLIYATMCCGHFALKCTFFFRKSSPTYKTHTQKLKHTALHIHKHPFYTPGTQTHLKAKDDGSSDEKATCGRNHLINIHIAFYRVVIASLPSSSSSTSVRNCEGLGFCICMNEGGMVLMFAASEFSGASASVGFCFW